MSGRANPGLCLRWGGQSHSHPALGDLRLGLPPECSPGGPAAWRSVVVRGGGSSGLGAGPASGSVCAAFPPSPLQFLSRPPFSNSHYFLYPPREKLNATVRAKGPRATSLPLEMIPRNDLRNQRSLGHADFTAAIIYLWQELFILVFRISKVILNVI